PDAALNTIAAMERLVAAVGVKLDQRTSSELRIRKGLAYLRLGEQENCLVTDSAEACLFPLSPKAYHSLPRGSRGAIGFFTEHLTDYPHDLGTRWLLNLAHMTIGEYPAKVDPRFLIAPEHFDSEYEMPRFTDVSAHLGLDANDLAGGTIIDDFDNDGLLDLMISAWDGNGQLRYFRNAGSGKFEERTSEAGLVGEVGALNIAQTDYNNDGFLDIWLMRGGWLAKGGRIPNSLLRNNKDGTFTDVTAEAGLLNYRPTMATRWFDFNGDGWLDLFVGNESVDPNDPDPCELFRNNQDGTFTECAVESGINIAQFVKGVACADYDNDGRPDLYLAIRGENGNILLRNEGPAATNTPSLSSSAWRFRDVTAQSGPVRDPHLPFGTFFFDYDNDGWQDLLVFGYDLPNGVGDIAADYLGVTHSGSKTKLFRNNRNGTFSDVSRDAGLDRISHAMGHNYGDLDNDGWLDFYCGTGDPDLSTLIPNRMFRNAGGKVFQDVTTATGTGHLQKGHGISFADLNDDGAQDIYTALGGAFSGDFARNALFVNPIRTNHWLKLKLVGSKANRPAIGARVKITIEPQGGTREIHRVVSSGGSFGANPLLQEIGLGDADTVNEIEIVWPGSGTRQRFSGLKVNSSYEIHEGQESPRSLKLQPFRLGPTAAPRPIAQIPNNRSVPN
ncbi:MAG: CRTAC1 family protein, partial [Limisphaerales bacterium]